MPGQSVTPKSQEKVAKSDHADMAGIAGTGLGILLRKISNVG